MPLHSSCNGEVDKSRSEPFVLYKHLHRCLLGSLGLFAVASVADVGQGARPVVRVVAACVKVLALQVDLALLVHGEDLAGKALHGRAARAGYRDTHRERNNVTCIGNELTNR